MIPADPGRRGRPRRPGGATSRAGSVAPWTSALLTWLGCALAACSGGHGAAPATASEVDLAAPRSSAAVAREPAPTVPQATATALPVGDDDAVSGAPDAPVTLVAFLDYECPFCARVQPTLDELRRTYPESALRIVVKHNPLPFHRSALPAARAAQAVLVLAGDEAFFEYSRRLLALGREPTPERLEREAAALGVPVAAFRAALADPRVTGKVADDVALAAALGVHGTPVFRINGVEIVGAQPPEAFTTVIVAELAASLALVARGTPPGQVYAARVAENLVLATAEDADTADAAEDATTWLVPIGASPTRGPATALVTIVEFSDFACPFCKQAARTLAELDRRYPGELRFVFKHQPLAMHPRALPAAMLAIEAQRQRGDRGFWEAADRLWESAPALEDADLERIAAALGLDVAATRRAIATTAHRAVTDADTDLAEDLEARGTPNFFVNGRRVAGAQPVERFAAVIDACLIEARALVASGVPRASVYGELMRRARTPPPPETRQVAAPTAAEPSRGPRSAPVVLTVFCDFQCPFCARVAPTLAALAREFPRELRIEWRDLPLSFHAQARVAAEAAQEAFAQRGDVGFWAMHDLLFAHQGDPGGLEVPALRGYAARIGLDVARFDAALERRVHAPAIDADVAAAAQAGITGTPGAVVNGYFVSGARELRVFRRAVRRALEDHRRGQRP